jgi:energy-coupling factor transporter ATP-binding protein EcfA2
MDAKRTIPVVAEKALKNFHAYLVELKDDFVCGTNGITASLDDRRINESTRKKQSKLLEHMKFICQILPKHMELDLVENCMEQELVELANSAQDDVKQDFFSAQARWVDLLLDKVSEILDSTQYVNLERLTELMQKNDVAGDCMEGKDVILLLGSAGSGKTTTLHYLAGTSFREAVRDGFVNIEPVEVLDPNAMGMKISNGGKEVITRSLQVAEVQVDGKPVVVCDTPSFGDHETIEEIIANSLGLVRAVHKAKTVRPIFVLSRDEIGFRDRFNAYPQILSILCRLLSTDVDANLEPFNFIFTKYEAKNVSGLRRQLLMFLDDNEDVKTGKHNTKQQLIKCMIKHSDPEANIVVPTNKAEAEKIIRRLVTTPTLVKDPALFFKPNVSDSVLTTLKRQLKFTLLDLRSALEKDDSRTAIHRMQQMSKLANLLPEAGIYARHGFKAFKEIISKMVEEDDDGTDDESSQGSERSSTSEVSEESWSSSESEQWGNVSAMLLKKADESLVPCQLTTVPEETEEYEGEEEEEKKDEEAQEPKTSAGPSPALLELAARCDLPKSNSPEEESSSSTSSTDATDNADSASDAAIAGSSNASNVDSEPKLPSEDAEYTEHYATLLREMAMKAIDGEDYVLALQRMREFNQLTRGAPPEITELRNFKACAELFLIYSEALEEARYPYCVATMKNLIDLSKEVPEAQKCAQFGLDAAVRHVIEVRDSVVDITSRLHEIEDHDEFDQILVKLRGERRKMERSNMLVELCMRECTDKGRSETMIACLSYGFQLGRLSR